MYVLNILYRVPNHHLAHALACFCYSPSPCMASHVTFKLHSQNINLSTPTFENVNIAASKVWSNRIMLKESC